MGGGGWGEGDGERERKREKEIDGEICGDKKRRETHSLW